MAWCDVVEPRTLRECRIALGQSQAAFAVMLGVSPESYRTWDARRRATPPHVMARAREVRQGHRRVRDDQRHVPVRAEAQLWCRVSPAASPSGRVPDSSIRCRLRRRPSCATTNRASASASHFHWST